MNKQLTLWLRCGVLSALALCTPLVATAAEAPQTSPSASMQKSANALAWTEWKLTQPEYSGLEKAPFLKFTDERISASVGLNSIGGSYKLDGEKLSFGPMLSTKMAGPPALMKAEDQYVEALNGVQSYALSEGGVTLTLSGKQTLRFHLTGRTPAEFETTGSKIINVAPELGAQMGGDKARKYLQLEDLSSDVSWGKFTAAKIEGFDFVPGYRYQLRVVVEINPRSGEKRLRLLEIFSRQWMRNVKLEQNQKILEVAPTRVDCHGADEACLLVREAGGQWHALHNAIKGFEFRSGWRYRLQVATTSKKSDADARYTLVRVLDQSPVTY
jgi:heat shock protein HslJ